MEFLDKIPLEYRPDEKMITVCVRCGRELLKKRSVAIYFKRTPGCMRVLAHFCQTCFTNFLDDYEISEP